MGHMPHEEQFNDGDEDEDEDDPSTPAVPFVLHRELCPPIFWLPDSLREIVESDDEMGANDRSGKGDSENNAESDLIQRLRELEQEDLLDAQDMIVSQSYETTLWTQIKTHVKGDAGRSFRGGGSASSSNLPPDP
jgi:hypothetical protein